MMKMKQKKKFKEKNKNSSFIQELFYSIKETISSCSEGTMSTYIFEYIPFVLIEDEEETIIKLSEKLFNSKTEEKNSKCHFCGGTIKKCKIEIKINEFSNILIILVNDKVKNFQTETLFYNKNQGISYILFCFIEKDTNDVYTFKNNIWYKYNENYQLEKAKNKAINPQVLFYQLINLNNNMNNNQAINNNQNWNQNNALNGNQKTNNRKINNNNFNNNMNNNM